MKSTTQLTNEVVISLQKFNNSERTVSDRIALRSALLSVIAEVDETEYEGEYQGITDVEKECLCELLDELIPLKGEIGCHVLSVCGSGSIGYTILSDSYKPTQFV